MGRVYLHTASTAVIICRRRDTPDISAFSGIEATRDIVAAGLPCKVLILTTGASTGSGWLVTASRRKGRVVRSGCQAASNLIASRIALSPDGLGGYPDCLGGYPRSPGW